MKFIISALLLMFSVQAFACGGGVSIELNDDKKLTGYGLIDVSSDTTYMFADDLKSGMVTYTVSDSRGVKTHRISLEGETSFIRVEVQSLTNGEVTSYKGQYGMYRGCNELILMD
jgi:nucleoside-triphosphatase THEP1